MAQIIAGDDGSQKYFRAVKPRKNPGAVFLDFAAGLNVLTAVILAALCLVGGNYPILIICALMVGASVALLWFTRHQSPAKGGEEENRSQSAPRQ